jgi:serine/threonine protein kinase
MADVYRAHDLVLGRAVAVKLLRNTAVGDRERARFTDEARTLARLNHPGLVTILDAAVTDDVPYQVMELVEGPSLADCCRAGALEPARVAAIGAQLADALAHAHEAGIVHRDLKPGNVLLGADNRALLTDFGIARLLSAAARHTITGATIGTPAYLAPEQVRGRDVTPATDVYALGLVLLEALTGKRAYRGAPVEAALARLTASPAIPDAVPAEWHGLLRAMTASEPAERPSAAAVASTLRGLASGVDPAAATAALRIECGTPHPPAGVDRDRELPGSRSHETRGGPAPPDKKLPAPRTNERRGANPVDTVRTASALHLRPGDRRRWAVAAVAATLVLLFAVLVYAGDRGRAGRPSDLPAGVPPELIQPLRDLHEAVEG